jgi:hypothetical protein
VCSILLVSLIELPICIVYICVVTGILDLLWVLLFVLVLSQTHVFLRSLLELSTQILGCWVLWYYQIMVCLCALFVRMPRLLKCSVGGSYNCLRPCFMLNSILVEPLFSAFRVGFRLYIVCWYVIRSEISLASLLGHLLILFRLT